MLQHPYLIYSFNYLQSSTVKNYDIEDSRMNSSLLDLMPFCNMMDSLILFVLFQGTNHPFVQCFHGVYATFCFRYKVSPQNS